MPAKGQDMTTVASPRISLFLARLLGPIFVAIAIGVLANGAVFRAIAEEGVWVPNWRVLITLLGWLMLVRGAARILFTDRVMEFAKTVVRNKRIYPISGAVVGVLGLVLCYFGYIA